MSMAALVFKTISAIGDRKKNKGLTTPDSIQRFDNVAYGSHKHQKLDVYRPKSANGSKLPLIVNFHGGGWVYGDESAPLGHVFHCNIKLDMAKKCNDDECAFFKKTMRVRDWG